jgi:hypothetical protein
MKTHRLHLFILSILLSVSAQTAGAASDDRPPHLSENLILRLVVEERDEILVDLQLLLARRQFSIDHLIEAGNARSEPLSFQGMLDRLDDGTFLLSYSYRRIVPVVTGRISDGTGQGVREQVTLQHVGWESTAILKLGEEAVLLRELTRSHRVSLTRAAREAPEK